MKRVHSKQDIEQIAESVSVNTEQVEAIITEALKNAPYFIEASFETSEGDTFICHGAVLLGNKYFSVYTQTDGINFTCNITWANGHITDLKLDDESIWADVQEVAVYSFIIYDIYGNEVLVEEA